MSKSNLNRLDPKSQFMLTYPGCRLPVAIGSPPGIRFNTFLQAEYQNTTVQAKECSRLSCITSPPGVSLWKSQNRSYSVFARSLLRERQRKNGDPNQKDKIKSRKLEDVSSWQKNPPSLSGNTSSNPGEEHQHWQESNSSSLSVSNSIVNDKAVRARVIESPLFSTTRYPRNKGSYSPAMQNRYQVTVPSMCLPPGQIVRRPGNLHSPPENSQPLEPINK